MLKNLGTSNIKVLIKQRNRDNLNHSISTIKYSIFWNSTPLYYRFDLPHVKSKISDKKNSTKFIGFLCSINFKYDFAHWGIVALAGKNFINNH